MLPMLWFSSMRRFPAWLVVGLASAVPGGAAALTGVCPDGSIYIVQEASQIPCREAKAVELDEVPPITQLSEIRVVTNGAIQVVDR